jgi:hypothetical protein
MPPKDAAINTVTVVTAVTIFRRGSLPIVGTHARSDWRVCGAGPGGYREFVGTAVTVVTARTLCNPTNGAPLPY